jgi:predicted nucleic acid-binding protein
LVHLRQRQLIIDRLQDLPCTVVAEDVEVLKFIDRHTLSGFGIGYVDAHLLAAARLTPAARLWTRDKRLSDAAQRLNLAAAF